MMKADDLEELAHVVGKTAALAGDFFGAVRISSGQRHGACTKPQRFEPVALADHARCDDAFTLCRRRKRRKIDMSGEVGFSGICKQIDLFMILYRLQRVACFAAAIAIVDDQRRAARIASRVSSMP